MDNVTYCLYARKSSERDELQALSIDSQIQEMQEMAERDGINVVEIKRESHSAKDSGQRPVFLEMIREVYEGKFNGILTWAPDRLSRNAGDLGALVDLMDRKMLHEIRTHGQTFSNSPNEKFLLMILCSQAKLENDNRGLNVKRGLRAKCQMGYRPGIPPLGYINNRFADKGQKKVELDPLRAPVIKEMFEKVANEGYSGHKILHWLNNETDFTTRSGKQIVLSTIYLLLRDTYYYGHFEYPKGSGTWYDVAHESIITKELFNKAQENIVATKRRHPGTLQFDFTRLIHCGQCGSSITAEEKFKQIKDGSVNRYVYYRCSKGKRVPCDEPYLREEQMLEQLLKIMGTIDIDELCVKKKLTKDLARYQKFMSGVFTDSGNLPAPQVDMRSYAKYVLREGTRDEKHEILSCLKSQLQLKDQKISLKKFDSDPR